MHIFNNLSLILEFVYAGEFLGILGDDDEGLGVDAGGGVEGAGKGGGGGEDDQAVEDPHPHRVRER